ncbi:hypothetical protein F5Y15DRAFT_98656 [Xylariaceae sp. FL0016]|nr:hypothetical protein F5Y15DRAFT_98656 [Xylariaceae sp. FL0016]
MTLPCAHEILQFDPSPWAHEAGFDRPSPDQRMAATTRSGQNPFGTKGLTAKALEKSTRENTQKLTPSFPGPLVLPFDDLNWDPDYPGQSFRSWLFEKARNKPTDRRHTLYVAAVPEVTDSVAHMREWVQPTVDAEQLVGEISSPPVEDFVSYLSAFYHGLVVKALPQQLRFVPWKSGKTTPKPRKDPTYVGFAADSRCTRIRTRPSPDGVFKGQLNLNDLLDAAISWLPADAYAIVLLMDHDLYEDEDDDFCCGRAYGGSRVSTVSSARYHPALDTLEKIDHSHMWPASHCKDFVDGLCATQGLKPAKSRKAKQVARSPMQAAVQAAADIGIPLTLEDRRGLWFSRLARTVAHELGHCLGMDHCVYYACNLQGTAGMAEDVRQPPYLCPVCLSKVQHAVAYELQGRGDDGKSEYVRERYAAIVALCDSWKHVALFAGYGAWIRGRLEDLGG